MRLLPLLPLVPLALATVLPAQILPFPYHIDDFPNGLRLVTIPTTFPDVVSVSVIVATGSRNEVEPGKSGFAHFFEHMMFRGTKNYTPAEQAAAFKAAGADRNAYTTDDYTNYHTTVTAADLETVLRLEADRFQHLQYSPQVFRTEAMAVLGEYNKNSANPISKMFEVLRDTAFDAHTYEHTTMGFLRDIRAMPKQFEYSKEFFSRWYRPEHTTILVVGDTTRDRTKALVTKYWADWQRGSHTVEIPVEPPQPAPRTCHVPWPSPTKPWLMVAFRGPAFDEQGIEMPALDVLSSLAFSSNSDLYRKLYVREQKVDQLFAHFPDHRDPYLLIIGARLRDPADWGYVRDEILATCEALKSADIADGALETVKAHLRYSFATSLDSSEAIASALAGYIARTRTPETVERVYDAYERITPADLRAVAQQFFVESGRTIATLSHEPLPAAPLAEPEPVPAAILARASQSPLVSFRFQLAVGAADDPEGKEGLANLTARLLTGGATEERSYEQLIEAFYPLAAGLGATVDKQMTTFSGTVHREVVGDFYALAVEMLQRPAFAAEDFERVRNDQLTALDIGLRRTDDEELGKEVLYAKIFQDHPYGHPTLGTIDGLKSITLDDVRAFYDRHYTASALRVGLAGGISRAFVARVHGDFYGSDGVEARPASVQREIAAPVPQAANLMTIVEKPALATGLHIGFPIAVTRGHPDWVALWLVRSFFGEHRSENSYLYQRLREIRGLNYGDYAYIEHFPNGGGQFHPPPNVARSQQIFQVWIRPVPHDNAAFALKAAWYELDKLCREGLSTEAFEATRSYLSKFVSLLVKTEDRALGYALDSEFYGVDEFVDYVRDGLDELTLDDVNRAIHDHLRADRLQFVVVTEDGAAFRDAILGDGPTPITYQQEPAAEILAEDAVIEALRLDLTPQAVEIVPIERVFAR